MSLQSYSTLDESSLRLLLDQTLDLDERRLIRSALRELRRREIQDMEAELARKRSRPPRLLQHEDKENQEGPDAVGSLVKLSGRLQGIEDLEELTKLLRSASDYEERKIIRAAIRRLRDEEQQGSERGRAGVHILEAGNLEPQCTLGVVETERETLSEREPIKSQIRDSRGQPTQQGSELHKAAPKPGMVLVLDPLVQEMALGPTHLESAAPEPELALTGLQGHSTSPLPDPGPPERSPAEPPAARPRADSGASDQSQASERSSGDRPRTDSCSSGSSGGPRPSSGTGSSGDSGGLLSRKRVDSGPLSEGREAEAERPMSSSPSSMDSETDDGRPQPCSSDTPDQEQPDGAALAKPDPCSRHGLLNGSAAGQTEVPQQEAAVSPRDPPRAPEGRAKDTGSDQAKRFSPVSFIRTSSVRDRMRKFCEPRTSDPPLKKTSLENGGPLRQRNPPRPASLYGASLVAPGDRSASASDTALPPGGAAGTLQPSTGQWQSSVGGARSSAPGHSQEESGPPAGLQNLPGDAEADMKTFLTIEIKDGRSTSASSSSSSTPASRGSTLPVTHMAPRITTAAGQRAELTLGLRATPFKMSSSSLTSASSFKMETEPGVASEPLFSGGSSVCGSFRAPAVPNGSGTTGTTGAQTKPAEQSGKLTESQLAAIEDEELLDRMLDESKDFEERRLIRAAMRDLRKRKREVMLGCSQEEIGRADQREKEREVRLQELRQQREERGQKGRGAAGGETLLRKVETSADGSSHSQLTKTDRFAQSDDGSRSTRSSVMEASYVQKTDRGTVQSKSYSFSSSTSSMSSSSSGSARKVGSVFDREDATPLRGGGGSRGGLAAVERRQAEQRKELMRAQSMPKGSAMTARKAMIERLEKEGGGPGNQAVAKVQRSTSFGVPNANSIKQMLLDWCRAKTRCYENVEIQNFSSSWSSGMAFCALVHHFFPDAFDYEALSPSNRRHNFEVAFSNAEKLVDCPQLLDVDDMVKMREPDWKCVYTYLQEFYRGLVLKGLVKTKSSASS
ncbi:smoothelin-like isoform X2 [Gadus chalcogrammus]|uniref:smoothelin-like isoform X2 n=1 Tax=Gadus chalcogrammus TaxID=1042646 RepID=UPI0024C37655|nr:smoothelin-like isoform X2 [Gadus chalcogrammus]